MVDRDRALRQIAQLDAEIGVVAEQLFRTRNGLHSSGFRVLAFGPRPGQGPERPREILELEERLDALYRHKRELRAALEKPDRPWRSARPACKRRTCFARPFRAGLCAYHYGITHLEASG